MSNRGADWAFNANNPNLTPLPPRPPRAGIGAGASSSSSPALPPGPPPGTHYTGPPPSAPGLNQGFGLPPPPPPPGWAPHNGHPSGPPPPPAPGPPPGMGMGIPGPPPGLPPGPPPPPGAPGSTPPLPAPVLGAPEPATTLFVGSIAAGVTDTWLTRLLEACGNLRQLKRVNKAFGFAEFTDPSGVQRGLGILNGLELPAFEDGAPAKKLLVKADEKTKKYMAGWESGTQRTDQDDVNDSEARSRVQALVKRMQDPIARKDGIDESKPAYEIPAHLKDLASEELPEEHRGSVLNEIEQFRQAAAAREEAARKKEIELERQRAREREERERMASAGGSSRGGGDRRHPNGPPMSGGRSHPHDRSSSNDPQSYNRPLNFVSERNGSNDQHSQPPLEDFSNLDPEERDEAEERRRKKMKEADDARAFRDAEHRAIGRERARISHWERELAREKQDEERRQREREKLLALYTNWSESEAHEREMFYIDRARWRHHRKNVRAREVERDEREEREEEAANAAAAAEAERFLAQQAAEMAALQERQRAAGILIPGSGTGAIKLNIASKKEGGGVPAGAASTVAGGAASGGGGMKISIGLKKDGIGASLAGGAGVTGGGFKLGGLGGEGAGAGGAAPGASEGGFGLIRKSVLGDADEDDDGLRKRKLRKIVLDDEDEPKAKRR
ncbi:hypothetical protein OC845_000986 [Tilletia horrida]|nr:hypothetical protein OC845_000986 [Tilletia horrida]